MTFCVQNCLLGNGLSARCSYIITTAGENSGTAERSCNLHCCNNGNGYTVFELNTGDEITLRGPFQVSGRGRNSGRWRFYRSRGVWKSGLKFLRSNSRRQRCGGRWREYLSPGDRGSRRFAGGADCETIRGGYVSDYRRAERLAEIKGSASARRWILHPRWKKSKCGEMVFSAEIRISNTLAVRFMKPTAAGSTGFWKKSLLPAADNDRIGPQGG